MNIDFSSQPRPCYVKNDKRATNYIRIQTNLLIAVDVISNSSISRFVLGNVEIITSPDRFVATSNSGNFLKISCNRITEASTNGDAIVDINACFLNNAIYDC